MPVDGFKWEKKKSRLTQKFTRNYDDDSDKGYILEVDVSYPKRLQKIHRDLPFLPERMMIEKSPETCLQYLWQGKLCCTHKNPKAGLGLRNRKSP